MSKNNNEFTSESKADASRSSNYKTATEMRLFKYGK